MKEISLKQEYIPVEGITPLCKKLCRKKKQSLNGYMANMKLTIYTVRPLIQLVPLRELTIFERVPRPSTQMISAYAKHRTHLSVENLAKLTGLTDEKALELMFEVFKELKREFKSTKKQTCSVFDLETFLEGRRYDLGKENCAKKKKR